MLRLVGKPILAFLHAKQCYSPMVTGLHSMADVLYVQHDDTLTTEYIVSRITALTKALRGSPVPIVPETPLHAAKISDQDQ